MDYNYKRFSPSNYEYGNFAGPKAGEPVPFGISDVLLMIGLMSLWSAAVAKGLLGVCLIPRKDPRLAESLAFENM